MYEQNAMPAGFTAGETVLYRVRYPEHLPTDGWSLEVGIACSGSPVTAEVTKDGDYFLVHFAAGKPGPPIVAGTYSLPPGVYTWSERVTKAGESYEVSRGSISVRANLFTATAGSLQSVEEKMLAVVEAKLLGTLADGMQSYVILGRQLDRIDPSKLWSIYAQLKATVAKQRGGRPRPIHITFPGIGGEQ